MKDWLLVKSDKMYGIMSSSNYKKSSGEIIAEFKNIENAKDKLLQIVGNGSAYSSIKEEKDSEQIDEKEGYQEWLNALDYEFSIETLAVNYPYYSLKAALYDEQDLLSKEIRSKYSKFAIDRAIEKYALFSNQRKEVRDSFDRQTFTVEVSTSNMNEDAFENLKKEMEYNGMTIKKISKV